MPSYQEWYNANNLPSPYKITYNGKSENFFFSPWEVNGGNPITVGQLDGYKLITTFFHGQKLYALDQGGDNIKWSILDQPQYIVEDVDHSLVPNSESSNISEGKMSTSMLQEPVSWIKKPPLMSDVMDNYMNDLSYGSNFSLNCHSINTASLSTNTTFSVNVLEPVMTAGNDTLYFPTKADSFYNTLYEYFLQYNTSGIASLIKQVTYDQFIQSFPILVRKDAFGEYSIYYRDEYSAQNKGCGKPVIYLYPTQKTDVKVSFSTQMDLTKTEPVYQNVWNVTAYPDGKIINKSDGKIYPYLFWEGTTPNSFPDLNYGNVVKKEDVKDFLSKQLAAYGLNKKESKDFIDYWRPYLNQRPYYLINFYTTQDLDKTIPEFISPKPNSVLRILMQYQGLDKPIAVNPPSAPVSFQRDGFTVVEWGGIYGN